MIAKGMQRHARVVARARSGRVAGTWRWSFLVLSLIAPLANGATTMMNKEQGASKCTSNLEKIYRLIKLHDHHSGGVIPADIESIYLMSKKLDLFVCPLDEHLDSDRKPDAFRTSYEIVLHPKRELSKNDPRLVAIVFEKRPNHDGSRFVLFYDGSIVRYSEVEFSALRGNLFVRA